MYDHDRCACFFCYYQQTVNCLCLHIVRTDKRMIFRSESAGFFCLINQSIDHSSIFTVYTGKAATFTEFFEDFVHITVINDHCRISHIQLEAGNSLIDHILNFLFRLFVPLYDRHVERIVTGTFVIRFLMPFFETFFERMTALVLRCIINDQRRSAEDCRFCTGLKIICRHSSGNFQVKMRMTVNKSRKQKFSLCVNHFCIFRLQIMSDCCNLFPFYQYIHLL